MDRTLTWLVLAICVCLLGMCSQSMAQSIEGISSPSGDATVAFTRAGRILKMLVVDGQEVKEGEVLAQQDDVAEKVQMEQLKAQADDQVRVKAAQAQLDQKKVALKKTEVAAEKGAATELEVQNAQLDVTIADLSLDLARFQSKMDGLKYKEALEQMERMKLTSPLNGKVEKILFHQGESPHEGEKVMRVVRLDPLWVEVPVPEKICQTLRIGLSVGVNFGNPKGQTGEGKITFIAGVHDAASNTVMVRLEVPNKQERGAGEHVWADFSTLSAKTQPATQPAVGTTAKDSSPAAGPTESTERTKG